MKTTGRGGVQGIVLAAGRGSRFGGAKMLASFDGAPLVAWAVRNALQTPIDRCVVVTGDHAESVGAVVMALQDARIDIVTARDWEKGLSASLQAGLRALPKDSLGVLIFLGDMPNISPRHGARLIEALMQGAPGAEMTRGGLPAHPVGFSAGLYPGLMGLSGDRGGRHLLSGRRGVKRFETEDFWTIADVDSQAALAALELRLAGD